MCTKLRTAIIFFLFSTFSVAQDNKPISTNSFSYDENNNNRIYLYSIELYEIFTKVYLKTINRTNNQGIIVKSNSFIYDSNNRNVTFNILGFEGNEMNRVYTLGKKGDENYITLIFENIPSGIEDISITVNPNESSEIKLYNLKLNNPNTHPLSIWNESKLKKYWSMNGIENFEGFYELSFQSSLSPKYKLAVKNENDSFILIYLSSGENTHWKEGEIKAILTRTATPNLFKAKWFLFNKSFTEDAYITFTKVGMKIIWTQPDTPSPEELYIKLYPSYSNEENSIESITSGTGFAISSSGYIVTNFHVIENCKKFSVRGIDRNFDTPYSAELVITDKKNDLAILKISDNRFNGKLKIPYSFKFKPSSVGESIYVLGYPLRATMGDEIKLTNGIISATSGYKGDITSYQISAPVQPGNSGGPTFDSNGNIIGIVNAKLMLAENVSYAIKLNYLRNLVDLIEDKLALPSNSKIKNKSLVKIVEEIKSYVYIIEGN